jgi:hypothetical protein
MTIQLPKLQALVEGKALPSSFKGKFVIARVIDGKVIGYAPVDSTGEYSEKNLVTTPKLVAKWDSEKEAKVVAAGMNKSFKDLKVMKID